MKMIFNKATARLQFKCLDTFKRISFYVCELEKNKVYQIDKMARPFENYKYELLMKGDASNDYSTRYLLLDENMFEKWFRFPIKTHWEIKLFTNEKECNDFLKELKLECLKDIKFTENQIMVIYLVKGEEDKLKEANYELL